MISIPTRFNYNIKSTALAVSAKLFQFQQGSIITIKVYYKVSKYINFNSNKVQL